MRVQTVGLASRVLSFCPIMLPPRMPLFQTIEKADFHYSRNFLTASERNILFVKI